MDIKNFPFLDAEEFTEACHFFDSQYCRAKLGPVRRQWKMKVCTSLDLTYQSPSGQTTYMQILRPLEMPQDDTDLLDNLEGFSFTDATKEDASAITDNDMMEAEDADLVGPNL